MTITLASPQADLEQLEERVRAGLRGSLDAGAALKEIRDRGLYKAREGYQTFEAYCLGVWRMTPRHSDRLIDFHDTVVAICKSGPTGPASPSAMNEGTLRPLARLSPPNKVAAFQAAVEFAATEGRPVAARHVTLAVQDLRKAAGRGSDAFSDIIKPTNNWNFNPVRYGRIDGERGHGYIPGEIYANCLWYYTKPGDVVAAQMAGGGQIMRVYEARHEWAIPEPWELDIRMFDLNPRGLYVDRIMHNDLTNGLPVDQPDYIVMDVPYFGMVEGQYSDKPEDSANMALDDWSSAMERIAAVCAQAQTDGALCTIICTDYNDVKTRRRVLASKLVEKAFEDAGYDLFDINYAPRHIQQNQTLDMGRMNNLAKQNRTPLTDMAMVLTFVRNAAGEAEQEDLPEDDDDKLLELINGHYQVGVMRLLERYNGDDLIGELRRIAVERVIDQHISWIDVLDLAEQTGFKNAVDAFQTVGTEYSTWRDEQAVAAAQAEPDPKPKAGRQRRKRS